MLLYSLLTHTAVFVYKYQTASDFCLKNAKEPGEHCAALAADRGFCWRLLGEWAGGQ
jgi:hypothetical protein